MEHQSSDPSESVILVLGDSRIKVNKEKLSRYSLYFASLFSEGCEEDEQQVLTINYEISPTTLQNFIHWANNEGEHTRVVHSPKYYFFVRASLEKFLTGNHVELLELLELSVVFMAEKLTENITEMIICMRLPPDNMLEIWLIAENLGLKTLRDVALAICLDRFEELPVSSLVGLSIEHFAKLVLNVNVRSSPDRLLVIREEWRIRNGVPAKLPDSLLQFLNCEADDIETVLAKKRSHCVQCVVGQKLDKSIVIYGWNGRTLKEITAMTDSQLHTTFTDNGRDIVGWQVIGRGFSIYLIGGEQGSNSGHFNTAIWRYCLFSKKWYIETLYVQSPTSTIPRGNVQLLGRMPRPRKHMAVAFLENKLYLFGGVGRHKAQLSSVDVFNVHTGIWSKATDIPENFAEVPPSCVVDSKFIYHKNQCYYLYDSRTDKWSTFYPNTEEANVADDLQFPVHSIIGCRTNDYHDPVVYVTDAKPDVDRTYLRRCTFDMSCSESMVDSTTIHVWKPGDGPSMFHQQLMNRRFVFCFAHNDDRVAIEVGQVRISNSSMEPAEKSNLLPDETYRRLRTYSKTLSNIIPGCFKLRLGCFNLIDPKSLHVLIPLPEQESINV